MDLRGLLVLTVLSFALASTILYKCYCASITYFIFLEKPANLFMTVKPLLDGKIVGGVPVNITAVPYQVNN